MESATRRDLCLFFSSIFKVFFVNLSSTFSGPTGRRPPPIQTPTETATATTATTTATATTATATATTARAPPPAAAGANKNSRPAAVR